MRKADLRKWLIGALIAQGGLVVAPVKLPQGYGERPLHRLPQPHPARGLDVESSRVEAHPLAHEGEPGVARMPDPDEG